MALINVAGRRPDEDPLTAMFQRLPSPARLGGPQQEGPPPPSTLPLMPTGTPPRPANTPMPFGAMAPAAPREDEPPPPPGPPPAPPPTPGPSAGDLAAVAAFYTKHLGRAAAPDDPQKWLSGAYGHGTDLASIENAIRNSDEGRAYAARQGGGGTTPPPGGRTDQSYITSVVNQWMNANNPQGHRDPSYWVGRILSTGGLGPDNMGYWQGRFTEAPGTHVEGAGGGQSGYNYPGTNVFDDPATANFEALLNSLITRFNTAQTPPHYQQAIDQLNTYLAQLNGPVYTPAQMELMQTQAWDPMQQQKDAAKQRLIQRLGSQGISPSSGIFESALADLDRQFQQAHTSQQAGFANQAIGLERQNRATAASLAPQISALEQAQTSWQDQRALQAELLAALIPQMASQRLRDASSSIQGLNPMSLLEMQNRFQNQGYGQSAEYGNYIMQLLSQLFGVGG